MCVFHLLTNKNLITMKKLFVLFALTAFVGASVVTKANATVKSDGTTIVAGCDKDHKCTDKCAKDCKKGKKGCCKKGDNTASADAAPKGCAKAKAGCCKSKAKTDATGQSETTPVPASTN